MKPQDIVENLVNEPYGPPIPDKWQVAIGSTRELRDKQRQVTAKLREIDIALQYERQLRKLGLTKDDVAGRIRQAHLNQRSGYSVIPRRSAFPDDAIVGLQTKDGREIMFDFPIVAD